jgi:CelD/BcsL family acetyltransferase involved in cellulose biosynthesis
MRVDIITPRELDAAHRARWHGLRHRASLPHLKNPFYTPEFAQLVGEVQAAARIGVIEIDNRVAGYFAFEQSALGWGRPLCARMSDHHGPVLDERVSIDAARLIRCCGLLGWHFDHLPADQSGFSRFELTRSTGWLMKLDGDFAAYRAQMDQRTGLLRRIEASMRRLERALGPLRFDAQSTDADAMRRLARWKGDQYIRTGQIDNFGIRWIREYLERLHHRKRPALAGMLSTLHAGDRLVAVHLGMRSEQVWHYYLPTYDRELFRFSPGLCLLYLMAQAAPSLGLDTIDFGTGDMDYKRDLSNAQIELVQGAVEPAPVRAARRGGHEAIRQLRRSPWVLGAARWGRRQLVDRINGLR